VHERYRQTDRQTDRQTGQRTDSIGRTVLQTVAQKWLNNVMGKVDCLEHPVRRRTVLLKDEELA